MSSTLAKSLPKSSTLYVISKGKVQHIRPTGPIRDIVTLLHNDQLMQPNKLFAHTPNCEDLNRYDTIYIFNF